MALWTNNWPIWYVRLIAETSVKDYFLCYWLPRVTNIGWVGYSTVVGSSYYNVFINRTLYTVHLVLITYYRPLVSRCRLRSASSHQLLVPPFRLTTVGRRTFPVAASLLWNSLPSDIQASSSLSAFHQHLKTFLFRQSFSDIILWLHYALVVYAIVLLFSHAKILIYIDWHYQSNAILYINCAAQTNMNFS